MTTTTAGVTGASRFRDAGHGVVRLVAWTGLLVPAGILESRSPVVIESDPFTPVTLFRGLFPGACLLIILVIARREVLLRRPTPREWLLAGYLAVVLGSTAWSLAPRLTLLKAGHLIVAYALLVALARHWRDRHQALRELTAVVMGVAVVALALAVVLPDRAFRAGRLIGVFPGLESVVLGMLTAVAVVAGFTYATTGSGRKRTMWVLTGAALAALLLTRTRAAVILAVLGILIFLWLQGRKRPASLLAGAVAAMGILIITPAGEPLRAAFLRGAPVSELLTFSGRFPLWSDALTVLADRPLVGYGYFAGHRLGPYADLYALRYGNAPYIDGTWAETALDLGLVGVVALALFVGGGCRHVWRSRVRRSPSSSLHLALLTIMVLYSVQDFTVQQVGYPMAVLGALLLAPCTAPASGDCGPEGQRREQVTDETPTVVERRRREP